MGQTKNARVVWKGNGLDFHAELGSGYALDLSANADATQGSPMELLLAGVAGCTAIDIAMILQKGRNRNGSTGPVNADTCLCGVQHHRFQYCRIAATRFSFETIRKAVEQIRRRMRMIVKRNALSHSNGKGT